MKINGWKYYNHAAVSTVAPHEIPDLTPIKDKTIWKIDGKKPLLARWTTEYDCPEETNWWYVVKDSIFDILKIKSKRRSEINKGIRRFDVFLINPNEYAEELYRVQVQAFAAYPAKYRPTVNKHDFIESVNQTWTKENVCVYGAFYKESGELCGYSLLQKNGECWTFNVQKTNPQYEKHGINAALVNKIVCDFNEKVGKGEVSYICDGERNILHETAFQSYLIKYFEFRKAFCKLNIKYNPKIGWVVKILYPFRKIIKMFKNVKFVHKLLAVFTMEEIVRSQKKCRKN